MTNDGKAYEALTEQVFTRLLAQSKLCAKVERDVVIVGKSTSHQIDVTFEFLAGTMAYRTIVQCKDWSTPVKQEQVLAFHDVLCDIPGQPRGIMISRSGYQEGARRVAAHHGIKLYELRPPRDEDWDGLIRSVRITGTIYTPRFENVRFCFDEAWAKSELKRLGIPKLDFDFTLHSGFDRLPLESGGTCDLNAILNQRTPSHECDSTAVHHDFEEAVMIELPNAPIPRLRVTGVDAEISVRKTEHVVSVSIDHMIAHCFRDVLTGEVRFLDVDGGHIGHE